jgi:predicted porin
LTGSINLQLQSDKIFGGSAGTAMTRNTFSDSQVNLGFFFNSTFSVQSTIRTLQVKTPASSNAFLEGQGVFLEQLFLNQETRDYAVYGGKFDPNFGTAWAQAPGVYGNNFSNSFSDYRILEAVGIGGAWKHETLQFGNHDLGVSAWFKDNTPLSETLGSHPSFGLPTTLRPGRLHESDGGPGNTRSLDSFSVSLRGDNFAYLPNFAYNLDFTSLAPGVTESKRQNMLAIGAQYKIELAKPWALRPLFEFVRIDNFAGNPGGLKQDRNYYTLGAELDWREWSISAVWSERDLFGPRDGTGQLPKDFSDQLYTASIGYQFDFGLQAQLGYARQRILDVWSDTAGLLLTYGYRF